MEPMNKTPSEDDIASTLTHLKLSTKDPQKPLHKPKSKPVADSWDEDNVSGSDTETEDNAAATPSSTTTTASDSLTSPISIVPSLDTSPHPPPPTPASPTPFDGFPDNTPYGSGPRPGGSSAARSAGSLRDMDKRPEKTTAVAGRLIAGALGVRAPKRTEEEREFDRVVRERERRRRAEEKEREAREAEERERRKKAVWED